MKSVLSKYIDRFKKLRSDTNRRKWPDATLRRAPHKPLLLLTVLDSFAQGIIKSNLIEITPDLVDLFTIYWARVISPTQRGYLYLPFFHLSKEGNAFWHLVPQPGKEAVLNNIHQVKSLKQLRDIAIGARLNEDLYTLLCVEKSRDALRVLLIETYFAPDVRSGLLEQGIINAEAFQYGQELLRQARNQEIKEAMPESNVYRAAARDQGFRRAIVTAYDHRCALCGIRMLTPEGHTVVAAAHIMPWSVSRNDDPRNGMALCQLCHWTFDEGLLGVSQEYRVLASPQLTANRNIPGHLPTMSGRLIIGPVEQPLWPGSIYLKWHYKQVFRKR